MRGPEKKKAFRQMCRLKVKSGLINQADGSWSSPKGTNDTMANHMRAGYHLAK